MAKTITKTMAWDIARSMTKPVANRIKEVEFAMTTLVVEKYESSLGKDLNKYISEIPQQYLNKVEYVIVKCRETSNEISFYLSNGKYIVSGDRSIILPYVVVMELADLEFNLKTLEAELKTIRQNIVETLVSLKSYSKVETVFPEAYNYLPKEVGENLPAVQNSTIDIMNKIKKYS